MARPKPESVFKTEATNIIHTIEGYVKPDKPDREVVFKTEATGIIHTIEGYVKPDKPDRVNVFNQSQRNWVTHENNRFITNKYICFNERLKNNKM